MSGANHDLEMEGENKLNSSLQFTQKLDNFRSKVNKLNSKEEIQAIVINTDTDQFDDDSNSPLLSQNHKLKSSQINASKLLCNERK